MVVIRIGDEGLDAEFRLVIRIYDLYRTVSSNVMLAARAIGQVPIQCSTEVGVDYLKPSTNANH